jgi:hypothetical protein
MPEAHDQKLTIMLTATELEMLRELAEDDGSGNMSATVRRWIRDKHRQLAKRSK